MIVGINVTPLVDVCLVLVIIFMVTAPLLMQPILPIDLPKAHTKEGEEKENITITITKEGTLALNEKSYESMRELERALIQKVALSRDRYVIVRAYKEALHGRMVKMMRLAKDAGAKSITIATEQKTR